MSSDWGKYQQAFEQAAQKLKDKIDEEILIELNGGIPLGYTKVYETDPVYKITGSKPTRENPQILTIDVVVNDDDHNDVLMTSRVRGGNSPDRDYPKKIDGNSRQSAKDRAIDMAVAKITKKLKKDYVRDVNEDPFKPRPQLLHNFDKQSSKIEYPALVSTKLDGLRCLFNPETGKLMSRGGEEYICPGILSAIESISNLPADTWLDGELYAPGLLLQDIVHNVHSSSEVTQRDAGLGLYLFDSIEGREDTRPYRERLASLVALNIDTPPLHIVDTKVARDPDDVEDFYVACIEAGLEGAIIRNLNGIWEWDYRSYDVQKKKSVFDDEFEILRVVMDVDDVTFGKLGSFICASEDGEFKVTPSGTKESRAELYENYKANPGEYTGRKITVEYRGFTKDGTPVHAVAKGTIPRTDI